MTPPPIFKQLVDRYGVDAVALTWYEIRGYPISWATEFSEVLAVADALS